MLLHSGAGKTTLMNALAYRTPGRMVVEGDILINGHKVSPKVASFSGYLHQHDIFLGSLTVYEHLLFMVRKVCVCVYWIFLRKISVRVIWGMQNALLSF